MKEPSIALIYSQFSERSHDVFRHAMRVSRDGVVQTKDLISGLLKHAPEVIDSNPMILNANQDESIGSVRPPLCNSKEVRQILSRAFHLARSTEAAITPVELSQGVVDQLSRTGETPPPMITQSRSEATNFKPADIPSIESILALWTDAHSGFASPSKEIVAKAAKRLRRWETFITSRPPFLLSE